MLVFLNQPNAKARSVTVTIKFQPAQHGVECSRVQREVVLQEYSSTRQAFQDPFDTLSQGHQSTPKWWNSWLHQIMRKSPAPASNNWIQKELPTKTRSLFFSLLQIYFIWRLECTCDLISSNFNLQTEVAIHWWPSPFPGDTARHGWLAAARHTSLWLAMIFTSRF